MINNQKLLTEAIKQVGLHSQSKTMWVVYPQLEEMAIRFAGYVGPHSLAENGKPLLGVAIKEAIDGFSAEEKDSGNEQAATAFFVRCLIRYGVDVFAQEMLVDTPSGEILWSPFVCGAIDFLNQFDARPVSTTRVESKISDAIASTFMMIQIIPKQMLSNDSIAELFNDMKVVL